MDVLFWCLGELTGVKLTWAPHRLDPGYDESHGLDLVRGQTVMVELTQTLLAFPPVTGTSNGTQAETLAVDSASSAQSLKQPHRLSEMALQAIALLT